MDKREQGFTLIELVVVIVIIGLLAAVAIPKFHDMTAKAEAASVKNIIGTARSALSIKVASGLVDGTDVSTWAYNGSNALRPMTELLGERPDNFLGELNANPTLAIAQGNWWDRRTSATDNWMMYKLTNPSSITGGWSNNGTNIIHRLEVNPDDTSSLTLTTTSSYNFTWVD